MNSVGHLSKLTDFILVKLTDRFLWNPEHLKHTKDPYDIEAHLGVLLQQSAHSLFSSFFKRLSKIFTC